MSARQWVFRHGCADPGSQVFLFPGQWWFGSGAGGVRRVTTLIGSCFAVTLWHARLRYGGMCHFLLAQREPRRPELDGRYGDDAIALLARATESVGTVLQEYEIGLFGGANILAGKAKVSNDLGAQNCDLAQRLLQHHGLVVSRTEMPGTEHRHLSLDLVSGAISLHGGAPR